MSNYKISWNCSQQNEPIIDQEYLQKEIDEIT